MFVRLAILSFAALTLSVAPGRTQCPGHATAVRYHPVNGTQPAVFVTVNHRGPYEFIVDTGAQRTVLDPSLAAALHLEFRGTLHVVAVARQAAATVAVLGEIALGSLSVSQLSVLVQDLRPILAFHSHVRGLLGGDFLSRFNLLIDDEHRLLCFDTAAEMQQAIQGERIPLLAASSLPHDPSAPLLRIPVRLATGRNSTATLLLDSGANLPVLYSARLRPAWWQQRDHARQGGAVGGTTLRFAPLPPQDVRIGQNLQRNLVFMALVNTGEPTPAFADDGLLPTSLFKKVFISYQDRYVVLEPR